MKAKLTELGYSFGKVDHEGIYLRVEYDGDVTCYKVFLPKGKKKFRYYEKKVTDLNNLPTFEESYLHERSEFCPRSAWSKPIQQPKKDTPETLQPLQVSDIKVIDYSDKAVAVYGNTKPIKEQLKSIGARFNMFLTIEGIKQPGWVLPISQREKLSFIQSIH